MMMMMMMMMMIIIIIIIIININIRSQNFTAKESNATSEIESTWKKRPKFTWPAHMLTCSPHVLSHVSVTSLLAVTCPCKN